MKLPLVQNLVPDNLIKKSHRLLTSALSLTLRGKNVYFAAEKSDKQQRSQISEKINEKPQDICWLFSYQVFRWKIIETKLKMMNWSVIYSDTQFSSSSLYPRWNPQQSFKYCHCSRIWITFACELIICNVRYCVWRRQMSHAQRQILMLTVFDGNCEKADILWQTFHSPSQTLSRMCKWGSLELFASVVQGLFNFEWMAQPQPRYESSRRKLLHNSEPLIRCRSQVTWTVF